MSLPPLPYHLLNSFVLPGSPHSGNQAAVVVVPPNDPRRSDDDWMRLTSRDFGYAETAFVVALSDSQQKPEYSLRWFTPEAEVVLCGHATLAAADVLLRAHPEAHAVSFQTRFSGTLVGTRAATGVEITLPIIPTESQALRPHLSIICEATGLGADDIADIAEFTFNTESVLVRLREGLDLKSLKVDIKAISALSRAMIIFTVAVSSSDEKLEVHDRIFAPGLGVDEDSVTGSAAAILTGYYLASPAAGSSDVSGLFKSNDPKSFKLAVRQVSPRGGAMVCTWDKGQARIVGQAVEWGSGQLVHLA